MSPPAPSGPACSTDPRMRLGCILVCMLAGAPGIVRAQDGIVGEPAGKARQAAAHPAKSAAAHAPQLTIASLGGGLQEAQQATLFTPFSRQSDTRLQLTSWDGSLDTLQRRAQTGADTGAAGWGLLLMEDAPLRVACREGLLLPDPRTADPADTAPDSSGRACAVPAWRMNLVLAWDRSRLDMVPTWSDFWDVARRPGKRGLRRDPRGTLEIALLADGVAPDEIYRTLATSDGVDRAFRKLDQLKPYIVWWNTPAEAVQIIGSGAVLMTSAPSGEIATANQAGRRSLGTQWAQSLGVTFDWAVPRATTPEQRGLAQSVMKFLAEPARQADFLASYQAVTADGKADSRSKPADSNAHADAVPAGTPAADGPGTPDHQRATLMMDDGFWADHLVALHRRFDAWIGVK